MKNKLFIPICYIIFTVIPLFTLAQENKIDSLQLLLHAHPDDSGKVNLLHLLSKTYIESGDVDNVKKYNGEALMLSKKLNYKSGEADALVILCQVNVIYTADFEQGKSHLVEAIKKYEESGANYKRIETHGMLGLLYLQQYQYTKARQQFQFQFDISSEIDYKKGIAQANHNIGAWYNWQSNFPEALKYQYMALRVFEELNDKRGMAEVYQDIGYININQDNFSEALKNFEQSFKINKELGDKYGIGFSLKNIGDIYFKLGNYEQALKYEFEALEIISKFPDISAIGWVYTSIGNIYEKKGEFFSQMHHIDSSSKNFLLAYEYYQKAYEKNKEANFNLEDAYFNLGSIYIQLKKYPQAREYLLKSIKSAHTATSLLVLKNAYFSLSKLDSIEGNFKNALINYKIYSDYRDSILNGDAIKQTVQEKMQFEFDTETNNCKS